MNLRRLVAVAAVAITGLVAAPGHAGPKAFAYRDAKGDALGNVDPGLDIVGVRYEGKLRGSKATTMLVTMTLAGAPRREAGFRYKADAEIAGCGFLWLSFADGTGFAELVGPATAFFECGGAGDATGEGLLLVVNAAVKGNTITWSVPVKSMPKQARNGSVYSQFRGYTDIVEPALGSEGTSSYAEQASFDAAAADGRWVLP